MCGRSSSPAASCLASLPPRAAVAQHPEADVGPPVGQRERPGVAGKQVVVEPHDQLVGGGAGDAADVLAEGVPLAEVAGGAEAERLARRAPHPVGGDDVAGGRGRRGPRRRPMAVPSVDRRRLDGVAEAHVGAGGDGEIDEGGVELQPWGHGGVDPGAGWERHLERASRRGAQHGAVDDLEVGHGCRDRSRGASSSRRASVVNPSPQHLSRGNSALSTRTTSRPARRSSTAAATPAGPAPTTRTSMLSMSHWSAAYERLVAPVGQRRLGRS